MQPHLGPGIFYFRRDSRPTEHISGCGMVSDRDIWKRRFKKTKNLKFHLLPGPCSGTKFELPLKEEENKCLAVFKQK